MDFLIVIAALVFLMGVTIRHWFNTVHARKGEPHWTWLVYLEMFIAGVAAGAGAAALAVLGLFLWSPWKTPEDSAPAAAATSGSLN